MVYYKVKKEYDNKQFPKRLIYVGNELFTESEAKKYHVNKKYCDVIEINKNKTYFSFGARFEMNYNK